MELNEQHGYLEELFALKRNTWDTIPTEMNQVFDIGWGFDCSEQTSSSLAAASVFPTSSLEGISMPFEQSYYDAFCSFPVQEDYPLCVIQDGEMGLLGNDDLHNFERQLQGPCKMEPIKSPEVPAFNMGVRLERNNRPKKNQGQPSKNLMAERRRRKRLNDRLSMLRSIVPKISKMDRTSILGDTINYMKELLQRTNTLQQEVDVDSTQPSTMAIFKDLKPNGLLARNSPKFDVERREMNTQIEICCAGKPGLLLSTMNTMEALGLEIEHCVISCFNDFSMQASCSEDLEGREEISSEETKEALFRNAGYGGRCL